MRQFKSALPMVGIIVLGLLGAGVASVASGTETTPVHPGAAKPAVSLPPAVSKKVSFLSDVKPILAAKCYGCHGNGARQGGLSLIIGTRS